MEINVVMIGKRIKESRNNRGLTQAQLAELLDVSTSYLGMMERALGNVTLENLIKLSHVLETPVTFFIQDSMYTPKETSVDARLQSELSSMTNSQKEYVLKIIMEFKDFCKNLVDSILK